MFDINDTIPTDTVPQEYILSWQKFIYAAFRCDQHNDVLYCLPILRNRSRSSFILPINSSKGRALP